MELIRDRTDCDLPKDVKSGELQQRQLSSGRVLNHVPVLRSMVIPAPLEL